MLGEYSVGKTSILDKYIN